MFNAIDIQIMNRIFSSVAMEMGIVLQKAAFSPNIKERRDFSCAIFDGAGRLVAQAAHIPVHLGAMPDTVAGMLDVISFRPGDIAITNDPFSGGSHLPDITLVSGVFDRDAVRPAFYLAVRAHHADVGGAMPGSMSLAASLDEEGILVSPSLLASKGKTDQAFMKKVFGAMRNPTERYGDINAQVAAIERGTRRLEELISKNGMERLSDIVEGLLEYGEKVMRKTILSIPDGCYEYEDFLDSDGAGSEPVPVRVSIAIREGEAVADFTGSSGQVKTGVNTVRSVTCSAVYYVFFCLAGGNYPVNAGSLRPITVITEKGSLLDAAYPAPVAAGNVETSQRVADVVLGALAAAAPGRIPAAGCGSMNNIAIGGSGQGRHYTYYETIGGGMGGAEGCAGLSGVQVNMTNTLNTPVEAIEQTYPFMIEEYSLRRGSGGQGKWPGGDGLVRRYLFSAPATVTLLTDRRRIAPYGLHGGEAGSVGKNLLYRRGGEGAELLGDKVNVSVDAGDRIEIRTPGGGGYGSTV